MLKYLFKRDTILATIMVFVVMGMLALIPVNTHVLDPIKLALQDFDYNDMAYSQFNKNSHTAVDTGIVIINIGWSYIFGHILLIVFKFYICFIAINNMLFYLYHI